MKFKIERNPVSIKIGGVFIWVCPNPAYRHDNIYTSSYYYHFDIFKVLFKKGYFRIVILNINFGITYPTR